LQGSEWSAEVRAERCGSGAAAGIARFRLMLTLICVPGFCAIAQAQSLVPSLQARNSMFVLTVMLGLIVLGVAAAVVARRRDPKIYTSLDVERVVGTEPMAVLPDFSEVPNEVTEAHLMRLLSAMQSAGRERSPKNCVFTGVGAGAGATTVAARVKELLVTLGDAPLMVDATDASAPGNEEASWDETTTRHGELTRALLQLVGDDARGHRGQMVLADAAPVTESARTEFLIEHADCAIMVIESGGTTRAELRNAANILERLNAPAVGFVLNRVKLAKADRAFRRSVEEMTRSVQERSQQMEQQTLDTLRFAVESGRASLDPQIGLSAEPPLHAEAGRASVDVLGDRAVQGSAPAAQRGAEQVAGSASVGPMWPRREDPWWLTGTPTHANAQGVRAGDPKAASPRPTARSNGAEVTAGETTNTTEKRSAPVRLPRLTELRGTMFSTGIKELDVARHDGVLGGEAERRTGVSAPLQAEQGQGQSAQRAAYPQAAPMQETTPVKALLAAPKPEAAPTPANETKAQDARPQADAARAKLRSPKQSKAAKKKPPQDAREPYDDVEILPSRRGQYKRKD
jgi:hypothetical protein